MEYNALIREFSGTSLKIVGHVLLADLKVVPKDWTVKYSSISVDCGATNIEELCCGPSNPLHIYPPAQEKLFSVSIRNVFGKSLQVLVSGTETVGALKWKIFQEMHEHHPLEQMLYISRGDCEKKLSDKSSLTEYGISEGSSIFLKVSRGLRDLGWVDSYKAIDLEATYPRISAQKDSPSWARYAAGVNLCGACTNRDCISRSLGMEVVLRMGYGAMRITLKDSKFTCPACHDSLIFPDKFLVSSARSLIRYKRVGEEQTKTQLVESTGGGDQFQETYLGHPFLVEVDTVEPWRSSYCCVKCDTSIRFKNEEHKLECGHVYHKSCKPLRLWNKCKVCKVRYNSHFYN